MNVLGKVWKLLTLGRWQSWVLMHNQACTLPQRNSHTLMPILEAYKKKKKRESRLSCYELAFAIIQAIFRSLQIFQISAMRNSSQHRKVFICYKIASWKNEQWVGLKIFEIPLNYYFCWKIFIPRKGKLMEEKYYNIILDSSISEGTKCNQQFALAIFLKYDQS